MSDQESPLSRWEVVVFLCRLAGGWLKPGSRVVLPPEGAWEQLIEAASAQLVSPALSFVLRDRTDIPQSVVDYFEGVLFLNRERNNLILGGLATALHTLHSAGIEAVLLKGAASIASDIYPDTGMRIISDIDILVTQAQAEQAANLLVARGLDPFPGSRVDYDKHHHLAPLYDPETGLTIELHVRPLLDRWHGFLDERSMINLAAPASFMGSVVLIPSPMHRIIHNVVHNQLSDQNYSKHRLDARQMLELAVLVHRYEQQVDWTELRKIFETHDQLIVLQDTLEIAESLFDLPVNANIGKSGRKPLYELESAVNRSDVGWLLSRFTDTVRAKPGTLFRVFMPHSWKRLFEALRHDTRRERW